MKKSGNSLLGLDWLLILSTLAVIAIGCTYLASASQVRFHAQLRWLFLGLVALGITVSIGYEKLVRYAYPLYGGVLALLLVVLQLPAHRGARSWIDLPGFSIQPSELAKIALVLVLARHLKFSENQSTLRGLIAPVVLTLIPTLLILKQPDLGSAMIFMPAAALIFFASGARKTHLFGALGLGIAAAVPMWFFILKGYQKNRILAFLYPDLYESREAYQLIMSKIAIGTGGWAGSGWGEGMCNSLGLIPDRHTDFIFVVIAEEGGLILAGVLIISLALLVLCGLMAGAGTREPGGRLVGIGAASVIGVQAAINLGVVTGCLPTTGITLPLVSYGGSSMISTFVLIGLMLSVGAHRPVVLHGESFLGRQ
ncbi:MAG: FtsW/RodA/SpoVE family cell cycle protein [Planctomycetota bacterium]|jgi:rod shape determining protein RodA